jgi:hypothetical protein
LAGAGSARGRKRKAKPSKGGSSDDDEYRPPKKPAVDDSDIPEDIYDSDGVEITEDSDLRKEIVSYLCYLLFRFSKFANSLIG